MSCECQRVKTSLAGPQELKALGALVLPVLVPRSSALKMLFAFWKRLLSLFRKAGRGRLVLRLTLNAIAKILKTVH